MGSKHNVDNCAKDNDLDAMDSSDVWKESVTKPSLKTLITWNISKAIEIKPEIDLRVALSDIKERLASYDVQALISPDAHNLSCAFLAWQRLGHHDADSLISFVEQTLNDFKNAKDQCDGSYESVNPDSRDVTKEENISSSVPGRDNLRHKPKCEWGSTDGFGAPAGVVVKLPEEPQIVMRLTAPIRVTKKPSKQPCGHRSAPPVRDTTRKIASACSMEEGCIKTLRTMEEKNKALRERATLVAKRGSRRVELLDRAEMAWRDLESAYQRRLRQAKEKEDDMEIKIASLLEERNTFKAECTPMVASLQKKSEMAEKERDAMKQLEQVVCKQACIRLDFQKNDAQVSTQLTEHQCKISQLDRDLTLSEELEMRKHRMLASAVEAAQVVLHETERAQRSELKAHSAQVKQATQELLEEDSRNGLLKDRIAEYLEQKEDIIEDLEVCQAKCEVRMEDQINNLKKLEEELTEYEKKAKECLCKKPVNEAVEVKRTPSLAALCKCLPDEPLKETCSCLSLTNKLLSSLLRDLFGGLKSEMDNIGSQMPCHLLKCLEDKHKWDHSTDVKKHVRAYFSRLLLTELDIAISTVIEKKRDQWLHPPTRGSTHSSTYSHHAKTRKGTAKLTQPIFQEKSMQAGDPKSYCTCCKDDEETQCPYSSTVYSCLVQPHPVRHLSKTKRVPTIATFVHNRRDKTATEPMHIVSVKKDTKGTTMPLLQTLQPLDKSRRKNIKNQDFEKLSRNNNSAYKSTEPRRNTTFKAKKPTKFVINKDDDGSPVIEATNVSKKVLKVPQQFAINMCLCDKNNKFTLSDTNKDQNIEYLSQASSLKQSKPVLSVCPETNKPKESDVTALNSCTTKGECFHKLPSNTSVDRLISLLTKLRDGLTDLPEESIQMALNTDSLFKISHTNVVNNLQQLYSQMDAKISLNNIDNSITHGKKLAVEVKKHESKKTTELVENKCDIPKSSIKIPANQSEYMADINFDSSNEILHEHRKNIVEERENAIPLQCIHFAKCEGKGSVSASKVQLVHRAEIDTQIIRNRIDGQGHVEKLPMVNMLTSSATLCKNCIQCLGVTLTNSKLRRSLKKYSKTDNGNNDELQGQQRKQVRKINQSKSQSELIENNNNKNQYKKIGDVTELSSIYSKKCDTNIQFLGVLLNDCKTNRKAKEYPEEQYNGSHRLDVHYEKIRAHNDKSDNKRLDPKSVRGSCKTSYAVKQTEAVKTFCRLGECSCTPYNEDGHLSVNKSMVIKTNNKGEDILNNEACICCPTLDRDDSNDLELNTFQLLADHLKCQLEEFKLSVCKSSCMQNADEKSIVNEILLKVKKLISESASTVISDCTGNKKLRDGSWNRAHSLLQEYLKIKIERVRCLCDASDDNLGKSLVPCVLNKISILIDNDLQRLKDICKCKNVTSSNKSPFKVQNTKDSTNTVKNNDKNLTTLNNIEPNALTLPDCINSTSLPSNKSVQAIFHHSMETKSCEAKKICSHISEVQTDKKSDTDNRFSCKDTVEFEKKNDNEANQRPEEHLDKSDETVTRLVLPFIGCTMNCCCDRDIGCVCTKSTVLKNTDWLKKYSLWNSFAQKQSTNENASYLLKHLSKPPKDLDITEDFCKMENIGTNKDHTCESGVSANEEVNITLKISNPKLDTFLAHDASNDSSFPFISISRYLQDRDILTRSTHAISNNDSKHHVADSKASMTTDDTSQKCESSSVCNCAMVPVCHVKMLVDNIGNNLVKAECTCDSLKAVCPVHSQ